jgi:type IV pilus assembly protein PilB
MYKNWARSKSAAIVSRFKVLAAIDIAESRKPQDGRFAFTAGKKEVDLRVNTYPSVYGEKVVMRILDPTKGAIPLEKLGFSTDTMAKWQKACSYPNGIVLVTGPTGSGKSTSLYATLNLVNSTDIHMITVEDPVEYKFDGIVQGQINERAGMTFAAALRAMLRQDPDIIMVGEMRDRETIELAIRAALTGHLVFSTLHTNNAAASYSRLMDMGTDPFMLSTTVRAILAQRLIRKLCTKCRVRYQATEEEFETIGMPPQEEPIYKHKESGCSYCGDRGYRGRAGLYELLIPTPELNELVQKKSPDDDLHHLAIEQGMSTLASEGYNYVRSGLTSIKEINRVL